LIALLLLTLLVPGCAKKKAQQTAFLSARERYDLGLAQLQARQTRKATETLSRIDNYQPGERGELEPLVRLALADATFYKSSSLALIDARALYLDFVTLYGDHPKAPYAQFQAGVCSLKQVNHYSKDQSQTHRAIADLNEVDRRFPGAIYAVAARGLIRDAQSRLAEHDVMVGRYYLKKKKYLAASTRFREALTLQPSHADKEEIYYYLGRALVKGDNAAEGRIYLDKILTDYPNGRYHEQARKELSAAGGPLQLDVNGSP
jgi:outer membrane protein assembly factor BamD